MLGVCCAPFPIHLQVPLGPDQAMYFFLHPPSHLTHQHLQPFPSSKVQEIAPNWIKKNDKSFHTSRAGRVSSSQVGVEGSPTPHLQKGLLSSTCCVKWEGKAMILPLAPLPACSQTLQQQGWPVKSKPRPQRSCPDSSEIPMPDRSRSQGTEINQLRSKQLL